MNHVLVDEISVTPTRKGVCLQCEPTGAFTLTNEAALNLLEELWALLPLLQDRIATENLSASP